MTKNINAKKLESLGNLAPAEIKGSEDDVKVRDAQKKHGVYFNQGTLEEQAKNQKKYEKNQRNIHVDDYVFADYETDPELRAVVEKSRKFAKSSDTQVHLYLYYLC